MKSSTLFFPNSGQPWKSCVETEQSLLRFKSWITARPETPLFLLTGLFMNKKLSSPEISGFVHYTSWCYSYLIHAWNIILSVTWEAKWKTPKCKQNVSHSRLTRITRNSWQIFHCELKSSWLIIWNTLKHWGAWPGCFGGDEFYLWAFSRAHGHFH